MPDIQVSVLFTAYRQEAYVREAVRSVLAQDFSPLEIILSDDGSPDATFSIMREEAARYSGPHSVVLHQTSERKSVGRLRRLADMARGSFLVTAHGDDRALPHRVRRLVELAVRHRCSMVTSNALAIDSAGRSIGTTCSETQSRAIPLEELARTGWSRMLLGATFGMHRRVLQHADDVDPLVIYRMQDHTAPIRAALLSGIWYEAEPLLEYRFHPESMSARSADRTATSEIARATIALHELGGPVAMLATFDAIMRGRVLDARLRAVRAALERLVFHHASRAVVSHNALRVNGLVARWLTEDAWDSLPVQPDLQLRPASQPDRNR